MARIARFLKSEWKAPCGFAVFLVLLLFAGWQVYTALGYGYVRALNGRAYHDAEPGLFIALSIFFIAMAILLSTFVLLILRGWVAEAGYWRRRASRAPLDNATRSAADSR